VEKYVSYIFSLMSLLLALYVYLHKEGKEEREKREVAAHLRDERLKTLERAQTSHDQRFTGISQDHERHCEDVTRRFEAHDLRLNEIPPIREGMAEMRSQVKYMAESSARVEQKLDRLFERLTKQP
jgi:hypothetical protein